MQPPGLDSSPPDTLIGGNPSGGRLTIDLGRLADNWRALNARSPRAQCGAAVKADAYGIGLKAAATTLHDAGCRTFFVALAEEGLRLRAVLPEAVIYVLNGLTPQASGDLSAAALRPVLGSIEEIEEWSAFCATLGRAAPAALHIDTGMNRLGLSVSQARTVAGRRDLAERFEIDLVISHLACADTPDHPMNAVQLERFTACRALFPGVPFSLANSAGIVLGQAYHLDLVRPGIALYGGAAVTGAANLMHPVVTLEARILQVRRVDAGQTVGYGATAMAARDSFIAIVGVGYADGFHRQASGSPDRAGAKACVAGHQVPVFGRISMDMLALDVTDIPADSAVRGQWVELFGDTIALDDVARAGGTIGYELLTQLGARLARRYLPAGEGR
jgi:alanine racemase